MWVEEGGDEGQKWMVVDVLFSVPQDFADAMMDVKKAIEDVRDSKTLRQVLGSLLAIGNFLNGREVRGWVGKVCVVRE